MKTAASLLILSVALHAAPRALTLREAMAEAGRLNPDIQISRLRIVEGEAAAANAAAARRPQLSAVVGASYETNNIQGIGLVVPGLPSRLGPYRVFDARPVLRQTVVDLSLSSGIRAARERVTEARELAAAAREAILLAVMQLYLQALQAESRIDAAEARSATAEAVLQQSTDLEASGAASKLDVARAERQHQSERVAAIGARRDRDVLKNLLARTIGWDGPLEFTLEVPARVADVELAGAEARAISERPELKALAARRRALSEERSRAARERWPKVSFSGDFGLLGQGPDRSLSTYNIGAQLTVPLWTGGRVASEIAGAQARLAQADLERRNAVIGIAREVRQSAIEMSAAREAMAAAEKGVAAAREAVELAGLRFASGISSNIDAVQAQDSLAEAEDSRIRTRYEYWIAAARMARARGNVFLFFAEADR